MKALVMVICMLSVSASAASVPSEQEALASIHALFRANDQEGAARQLEELVVRHPSSTELRALHVNVLTRRDPERAWELARRLRYAYPKDPWSWYAVGAAGVLGDLEEQLSEGQAAIGKMLTLAKEPLPDPMLRLKVLALLQAGDVAGARAFLGDRDTPAALLLLAMTLESDPNGKQEDAAEAAYRRAQALAPDDVRIATSFVHFLLGRKPAEARELAKETLAAAPLSLRAHEMYWDTIVESRELTKEQKEAAIAADAATLLAARDWPENLSGLASWYRRIESAKEDEVHRQILERFPMSPEAEWSMSRKAFADRTRLTADPVLLAQRRRAIQEFIDYPVHHGPRLGGAYLQLLAVNRLDPTATDDELLRAVDGVRAYVAQPLSAKTIVAEALAERGLRLAEAEQLAREGVRETPKMIEPDRLNYEPADYERALNLLGAKARVALAAVLMKRNKAAEAGRELQAAVKLAPDDAGVNLYLGRWHEQKGDPSAAELAYARGMIKEPAHDARNLAALKALFERAKKDPAQWDVYVANLRQAGSSDEKRKVLAARLIPAQRVEQPFTLQDVHGRSVSLAEAKGRVTVVNFWGLWCGPCLAEMPDLDRLQKKYASDPKVQILTVNNDNDPAKVKAWLEKNGYSFPVLVDDGYIRKARIHAFPTTWFLDADGRIAFLKRGGAVNLVDEFSWRIESLKAVAR
jgi:thiol-disulfide isomerase/thioredoxin/Tfp pilus assembly protein PilF